MCGRYALNISGEDLALEFAAGIKDAAFTPSNWNISPTTLIPFINGGSKLPQAYYYEKLRVF